MFIACRGEVGGGELEPVDAVVGVFFEAGIEFIRTDGVDLDLSGSIDGDLPVLFSKDGNGSSDEFGSCHVPPGGFTSWEEGGAMVRGDRGIMNNGGDEGVFVDEVQDDLVLDLGIAGNGVDLAIL